MDTLDFVSSESVALDPKTKSEPKIYLLWGDRVRILEKRGQEVRVKARGQTGWVAKKALGGQQLLELYFIDVGQGDGIFIHTPDDRHILIDAGNRRSKLPTQKNAADFLDWKFAKDYGLKAITLEAMIASHCDADHFGGLRDLIDPNERSQLDVKDVRVKAFYHAGISRWKDKNGEETLGELTQVGGEDFFYELLADRASLDQALNNGIPHPLSGDWKAFLECVRNLRDSNGNPCDIQRLSNVTQHLPGFKTGAVTIEVLAPFEHQTPNGPGLHCYDKAIGKNTNGNSIVLKINYQKVRILLGGDLNQASQEKLLEDYKGNNLIFYCDVAKASHHGSDDFSIDFLKASQPAVTVISSGDEESFDHPRPSLVAASALFGHQETSNGKIVSPLIYSSEIVRSYRIQHPAQVALDPGAAKNKTELALKGKTLKKVHLKWKRSGKAMGDRTASESFLVTGVVYGLVNVRTDGKKILCATLSEKNNTWHIKTLNSRF